MIVQWNRVEQHSIQHQGTCAIKYSYKTNLTGQKWSNVTNNSIRAQIKGVENMSKENERVCVSQK